MSKAKRPRSEIVISISPLLVDMETAARMCGICLEYFRQLDCSGKVPHSVTGFGKRRLWSVKQLEDWVEQGCPTRSQR